MTLTGKNAMNAMNAIEWHKSADSRECATPPVSGRQGRMETTEYECRALADLAAGVGEPKFIGAFVGAMTNVGALYAAKHPEQIGR